MVKNLITESNVGRHHQAKGFNVISINGNSLLKLRGASAYLDKHKFNALVFDKVKNSDYVFIGTDADYMGQVMAEHLRRELINAGYEGKIIRMPLTSKGYLLSDFSGEWIIEDFNQKIRRGQNFKVINGINLKDALVLAHAYQNLKNGKLTVNVKNTNGSNTFTAMAKARRLGIKKSSDYIKKLYYRGVIAYPRVEVDYTDVGQMHSVVAHPGFFDDIDLTPLSSDERKTAIEVLSPIKESEYTAKTVEDILLSAYNEGIVTPSIGMNMVEDNRFYDYLDIDAEGFIRINLSNRFLDMVSQYYEEVKEQIKKESLEKDPVPVIKLPKKFSAEDDDSFYSLLDIYMKKLEEEKRRIKMLRDAVRRKQLEQQEEAEKAFANTEKAFANADFAMLDANPTPQRHIKKPASELALSATSFLDCS